MKSFEWGCQFGNEIVCARESFRLEINGIAIKTWELQYLVTIMIMTLAGGVNFRVGGGWVCMSAVLESVEQQQQASLPLSLCKDTVCSYQFSSNRVMPLRKYLDFSVV